MEINTVSGTEFPAITEHGAIAYLWNATAGRFNRRGHFIDTTPAQVRNTRAFACDVSDVDRDGDIDIVVTGFSTGIMPDNATLRPPLLTGDFWVRRKMPSAQPTRLWLNPGWSEDETDSPFVRGDYPQKSDKVYALTTGDIDGDGFDEIITAGADAINLFDDP